MMTDPIADFLIRIKNGYMASRSEVDAPWSKTKESLAKIMVGENYLKGYKVTGDIADKTISMTLSYIDKEPSLTEVRRISKPGARRYAKNGKLPLVRKGSLGIAIVSTPRGLMTTKEATKANLGGELICEIS